MTDQRAKKPKKPFLLNVRVKVKFMPDGNGNTADGRYRIKCKPRRLPVYEGNQVINYQLVKAPPGIVFAGFDKSRQYTERQISTPSISVDGTMMTFTDRNTTTEPILITLRLRDNRVILFDPEISNDPVAT